MNLPEWFHKKRRNSIELLPADGPGKVELGSSKVGENLISPKNSSGIGMRARIMME